MDDGNAARHVAATKMNERSSRSHSVFVVKIEQKVISTFFILLFLTRFQRKTKALLQI